MPKSRAEGLEGASDGNSLLPLNSDARIRLLHCIVHRCFRRQLVTLHEGPAQILHNTCTSLLLML